MQTGPRPVVSRFMDTVKRGESLDRPEELRLVERAKDGDRQALDRLVRANLGMVVRIAKKYRNMGIAFEDLLAEGCVGLMEAVQPYDAGRGSRFITYAVWWIRRAILKTLGEQSTLVRVSYHHKKRFRQFRLAEEALQRSLSRRPRREEVSARLDVTAEQVDRVLRFGYSEFSLDAEAGDGTGARPLETVAASTGGDAEDVLLRRELDELLVEAIRHLDPQERSVLRDRFGLSGEALTLRQIGDRMRVSRERVRQIECAARGRLRRLLERRLRPHGSSRREIRPARA